MPSCWPNSWQKNISRKVELMVVGDVPEKLKQYWEKNADQWITWQGIVGREQIPVV